MSTTKKFRPEIFPAYWLGRLPAAMAAAASEPDLRDARSILRDALEAYLRKHSPVRPRLDDRWVEDKGCVREPYLAAPVAEAAAAP